MNLAERRFRPCLNLLIHHLMKIEFDKALLWLVPYLYLVSVMYYWGYWGTFGIDAYSYYDISDLVKGTISHIGSTIYVVGGVLTIILFWDKLGDIIRDAFKSDTPIVVRLTLIGLLLAFGFTIFAFVHSPRFIKNDDVVLNDSNHELLFYKILSYTIPLVSTMAICLILSKNGSKMDVTYRYCLVAFITTLPARAFFNGKEQATRIEQNKIFYYIVADSIAAPQKSIYKYLGKTGDYNMLVTLDNSKCIAIALDKLSPLVTERFSVNDTISMQRFKVHQKELIGKVLKQSDLKQPTATSPPQQPVQQK